MKLRKKTKLQLAQDKVSAAIEQTNNTIEELGKETSGLYDILTNIQKLFDRIRNIPSDKKLQYEELKQVRLNWKQQADKIEKDYQEAVAKNTGAGIAGAGIAGAGLGAAVIVMGPTVAMGFATTFGVASTGTAISTLSGAAATNAALAWLGGGTLAAGGGGMVAGEAFLALAGPVGWTIAGISLFISGLLVWKSKSDKKRLEGIFLAISDRDLKSYTLAIVELKERISRITIEKDKLNEALENIQTFGLDYNMMTEAQQYELGSYVNLMLSSTQLLVNPIQGLLPKFSEADFIQLKNSEGERNMYNEYKDVIISLSNLLYKIELDERDKILLCKSIRKNKKMLQTMKISKKEFDINMMNLILEVLQYKYTVIDKKPM